MKGWIAFAGVQEAKDLHGKKLTKDKKPVHLVTVVYKEEELPEAMNAEVVLLKNGVEAGQYKGKGVYVREGRWRCKEELPLTDGVKLLWHTKGVRYSDYKDSGAYIEEKGIPLFEGIQLGWEAILGLGVSRSKRLTWEPQYKRVELSHLEGVEVTERPTRGGSKPKKAPAKKFQAALEMLKGL